MLMLLFQVGDSRYALDSAQIENIIPKIELAPPAGLNQPDAKHLAGLFNYQGQLVPVLDLGILLQGQPSHPSLSTRIALTRCGTDQALLGLMAPGMTAMLQINTVERATPTLPTKAYLGDILMTQRGLIQCIEIAQLPGQQHF
ncbi:MAG: chemotaxis protein CheW [Cyanobacteria bacterium J06635_1]